jgi:hypothetical protein
MMKTMMTLIAIAALAAVAMPPASAAQCATTNPELSYVVQTCNYVLSGEAGDEADATVDHVAGQAEETAQFLWDTYGDELP